MVEIACYVIFWNIAPKHWIYMDRGYCNSFYFYLWLYSYWGYVIECDFAVEGHIILEILLLLRNFFKSSCASLSTSNIEYARLVIGTSRTVCSAKKFVRITSGFGAGEFTKTLRKVCTCQKLKFSFLLLKYCKIRECYSMANAFTNRNMHSLFLYMKCSSRKINRPTKNITKIVTLVHL